MFERYVRVFSLVAILAAGPMVFAQSASELLEKGIYTEETAGDLDAAIEIYEQILMNAEANRLFAAQAQFRLGVCYAKKGQEAEASAAFRKVVDRYADQPTLVAQARIRLSNLGFGTNGETLATSTRQVWAPAVDDGKPSPDGRYLSYINSDTGNVAVHNIETGENRDITDEGKLPLQRGLFPIWSPDSRQVAYMWGMGNSTGLSVELRIVELDGSEPRVLSDSVPINLSGSVPFKDGHPPWPKAWSQDGQYILGLLGMKDDNSESGHYHLIVLVSVDDGSQRIFKLSSDFVGVGMDTQMSLSPNGRYAAFDLVLSKDSETRDICLLATEGSGEAAVVKIEHPADDWAPFWTPDGKRIVFTSDRAGSPDLWMLEMDEGKPKGDPVLLREMGKIFSPMGLTPDGSFYYYVETSKTASVYAAALDFEAGKVLAPRTKMLLPYEGSNFGPSWSPDGKNLAYMSNRRHRLPRDGFLLVIRSLETGEELELSPKSLILYGGAQWSPDGRSLLVKGCTGYYSEREWGLHLVDVQTGEFTTIMRFAWGEEPGNPVFSKDGKQIYYVHQDLSVILAHNLETGEEKEVHRTKTAIKRLSRLSPDGQRIAFIEYETVESTRPAMIKTLSISDGDLTDVYPLGEEIPGILGLVWTSDGDLVAIENTGDLTDKVLIFPTEGGDAREFDLEFEVFPEFSLHLDGQRIVFARGEGKAKPEIWMLENFLPEPNADK